MALVPKGEEVLPVWRELPVWRDSVNSS